MKQAFDAYPEFICLDATYKLLELGFPVYLMVCEDANGQSEIIAVCLLASEDADSIRWMIEVFKKYNPRSKDICVVMADKDIKERDVLKACLPNTSVLICLFHTLRSLRREVTCDKMGISSGQRILCLELLQKKWLILHQRVNTIRFMPNFKMMHHTKLLMISIQIGLS